MATLDFTTKPLALNLLMVLHLRIAYLSMTIYHLVNVHMKQPYYKTVGVKINYHLLTSIYVTSILSYTVLEDDANDEK